MAVGEDPRRTHLAGWFKDVPFDVEALREQPGDPDFAWWGTAEIEGLLIIRPKITGIQVYDHFFRYIFRCEFSGV